MRALMLPAPTPDELLDESLAGRSEPVGGRRRTALSDHDCPECGVDDGWEQPGAHHEPHCSGYSEPLRTAMEATVSRLKDAVEKITQPMQCAIAKGSEYTVEPLPMSPTLAQLGLRGPTTVRRYTAPYHVIVNGRLACEPSWEPEPSLSTHSVLHAPLNRLCRAPACRALWQPERDRARKSDRDQA